MMGYRTTPHWIDGRGTQWAVWREGTPARTMLYFDPTPTISRTGFSETEIKMLNGIERTATWSALTRWNITVVGGDATAFPGILILTCDPEYADDIEAMVVRLIEKVA